MNREAYFKLINVMGIFKAVVFTKAIMKKAECFQKKLMVKKRSVFYEKVVWNYCLSFNCIGSYKL